MYNFDYLDKYKTYIHGPIQKDEALFLHSLCCMIRPKVIIEFGFLQGASATVFTNAIGADGFVYSFDIDKNLASYAKGLKNHKLIICSQEKFTPSLLDHKFVDFVFIDASHNLKKNIECFKRIVPILSFQGIIAIHDTGVWSKKGMIKSKVKTKLDYMPAVRAEREFVQWISENEPEYHQIHFHAPDYFRHGITLLQKHQQNLTFPPIENIKFI